MLDPALLAAILSDPDADLPRLLAADWFDENGEPERAEFIRVQYELARPEFASCNCGADCSPHKINCPFWLDSKRLDELRRRERELLDANAHFWCPIDEKRRDWAQFAIDDDGCTASFPHGFVNDRYKFRRGFLHTIRCSVAAWQRRTTRMLTGRIAEFGETVGQQILRAHPVGHVEFTGEQPICITHLPEAYGFKLPWQLLHTGAGSRCQLYKTRDELIDAMPRQLLAWGIGRPSFQGMGVREYIGGVEVTSFR